MLSYFLLASAVTFVFTTLYIGSFAHAIPDRNEDFSVFLPR